VSENRSPVPGDKRWHSEAAALLLHHLLKALTGDYPDARFERHVARAPSATLVQTGHVAATALAAAIVMPLARMVAGGRARSGTGTLIVPCEILPATRIETTTNMRVGQERILDRAPLYFRCDDGACRGESSERGQRQFCEIPATEIDSIQICVI
jgi:hypothetical protein